MSSPLYAIEDWSVPLEQAQMLLNQGEYSEAYTAYLDQAEEKNNPLAQFSVALFHDFGWGRAKDPVAACLWYEKAALAKLPAAQHALGDCLLKGVNRPSDPARAAVEYQDAAQAGHWISLCSLAELYQRGIGVAKDPAKGIALCESVANRGIAKAMRITAFLYLDGDPSARDAVKGQAWLEQAAEHGDPEAQYRLGLIERDNAQFGKELELAGYWLESAAAQGFSSAYMPIAELYFHASVDSSTGNPLPEHLAKAYLWLSAALQRINDTLEKERVMEMLERVKSLMPESWRPELDAKVARHLAAFPTR